MKFQKQLRKLPSGYITFKEIREYVADPEWQDFRISLKGLSTSAKLDELKGWMEDHPNSRKAKVQVINYINALKRGGQIK